MKSDHKSKGYKRSILIVAVLVLGGLTWGLLNEDGALRGQNTTDQSPAEISPIFTPAHRTISEAVRHFFNIRSEPVQPLAYNHQPHLELAGLNCIDCHDGVDKGPIAHIPGVSMCMDCHDFIATESPVIQQLTEYYNRGEEPPWQRVYGWYEEAHVRFNHAPHIRSGVECATCHGDVATMSVAERVVDHSMRFCIECHEQEGASNDCLVCHY
jgi:hypothetical protein